MLFVSCFHIFLFPAATKNTTQMYKEILFKSDLTNLFHVSVNFHRRRLREIFRKYYNPDDTDSVWTKNLPERVINDLRLHLSWDLGLRSFDWSREAIGTKITYRFKELGMLLFMNKIIVDDHNN